MTVSGELMAGLLFAGRYEIEGLLGRGGMGAVYRARDFAIGEPIALKVLTVDADAGRAAAGDAGLDSIMRFRQEVRLARRVTHANVTRVYDLGEHEGTVFMTMELVQGDTLRALMRIASPFSIRRAIEYGLPILDALGAAHAAGVIHRDLKPSNVLVETRGRVVVTDFGIARALCEDSGLTRGAIGTPSYMAPEQAMNAEIDARTDLFAFGVLFFEMVTGRLPRGVVRVVDELVSAGVPRGAAAVVGACLALDPAQRPRTAGEVARALREATAAAVEPEPEPEPETRASTPSPAPIDAEGPTVGAPREKSAGTELRGRAFESERSIAVLPPKYRGPADQREASEAFFDELVDQLSRTRGLRVFGGGATARFHEDRDPRVIAATLGADLVIDGTVHWDEGRMRVTSRLIEGRTGLQVRSDRVEVELADALHAAEALARRVAEELRLEMSLITERRHASEEVVGLYLGARRRFRAGAVDPERQALAAFARCIELAPDFAPAYASHAMAALRAWFHSPADVPERRRPAEEAVERALQHAPFAAETHVAAGIFACTVGEYARGMRELDRALAIAPTCVEAHEYLGMLECEAGRADAGRRRLALALELEPGLIASTVHLARERALAGDDGAAYAAVEAAEALAGKAHPGPRHVRQRIALWRGDRERLAACLGTSANPRGFYDAIASVALGHLSLGDAEELYERSRAARVNPRFSAMTYQLLTELHLWLGDPSGALAALQRAVDGVLVDLLWLERCPLLDPLRGTPAFDDAIRRVRGRTAALWL